MYTMPADAPVVSIAEILRYMGTTARDTRSEQIAAEILDEVRRAAEIRVCYTPLAIEQSDEVITLGGILPLHSRDLCRHLEGCDRAILLGATLGVGVDRLIARYQHLSSVQALAADAAASALIEAVCDACCAELQKKEGRLLTARFSPGYGDLALNTQFKLFALLDCARQIGLTLTDACMMTPTKSVSAIVGVGGTNRALCDLKCNACQQSHCLYRKDTTYESTSDHP